MIETEILALMQVFLMRFLQVDILLELVNCFNHESSFIHVVDENNEGKNNLE